MTRPLPAAPESRPNPPAMRVRTADGADAAAVADVHVRSWKAAYRGQVPDDYLATLSAEQRRPMWRDILASTDWPTTGTLVVEQEDGEVIGFAHLAPGRDRDSGAATAEITSIYLAPEALGLGGGRMLMDEALDRLRTAGFSAATLWVLATNQRARQFYEAGGWSWDGAEKTDGHWGFGLRELRYRRGL